ncbi:hypothetical protein EPI10_030657 [Gossypium australe]|uniref:Uncharacterized protein n=1 Tax=Gossypium australe TaxID=47621 RepID=A0A5B6WZA5_9ROSI|nr:hypothetical protein EPI10_030657 [Gossypium australe]
MPEFALFSASVDFPFPNIQSSLLGLTVATLRFFSLRTHILYSTVVGIRWARSETATVLLEVIGYIRLPHDQLEVMILPHRLFNLLTVSALLRSYFCLVFSRRDN